MNDSTPEIPLDDEHALLLDELSNGAIQMARVMMGRYGPDSSTIDLSLPHFMMLRTLREAGRLRASDVADACGMKNSTVSMALQALEERGFVTREHDDGDRRVVNVTLTDEGLTRLENAERERRQMMRHYTEGISTEELRALASIMGRLFESMSAESGQSPQA